MPTIEKYNTYMSAIRGCMAEDSRTPVSIHLHPEDGMFMWSTSFDINITDKAEADGSGTLIIDGILVKNTATVPKGIAVCAYSDGSTNSIIL